MPALPLKQILDRLSQRPSGAFVYLHGAEEHLRDEAVTAVIDAVLDPATRDFNLDQLRGAEVTPEAIASLVSTPPMMAEYRVVVLRDAQGLSPKGREVVEATIAAEAPPGLVFVITATRPSGSKAKFYTRLEKQAWSAEFQPVDPLDLPGWLMERAREEHGKALEIEAARALGAAIGSDLRLLASELEKLAVYSEDRDAISLEDVRAVGGYVPRVDRWAWFELVAERRFDEALGQLPTLLETGESGVGLVIGMSSQLLRVALVVAGGREALERELKPYQRWLARKVAPQARRWSRAEIDAALAELLRTDRLLKSAGLTDRQAMEELLLRLHSLGADSRAA